MASDRVPAHDIMASGPNNGPTPTPPPIRRTPTALSSSSGRTQISINIQTMVRFTCPNCHHLNSGLRPLRFSRHNSYLNSLKCTKCPFIQVQIGGPRSPPQTIRPGLHTGHGSDDAEPSTRAGRAYNASRREYKPFISSALASSTHVARSFAISEADAGAEDGIQTMDFQPDTIPDEIKVPEASPEMHYMEPGIPASATTERRRQLRRRRRAAIFINRRVQELLDLFPHGVRTRLQLLAGPLDRLASQFDTNPAPRTSKDKGKEPMVVHETDPAATAPPPLQGSSGLAPASPPSSASSADHPHCHCTGHCHCSTTGFGYQQIRRGSMNFIERMRQRNNAPARSERSLVSSPQRPDSTNTSQIFFDLVRPNRFSRDSMGSVRYPSRLSFGGATNTERSMSRPTARGGVPPLSSSPPPPQDPHPIVMFAGHGAALDQHAGSSHDSAIFMATPRSSQSLRDAENNP